MRDNERVKDPLSPTASILIVDDQPEIRKVVTHVLERDGRFAIAEASTGDEALEIVETQAPDAVILDIAMPGLNGLVLLPRLKALVPEAKIVILSSHYAMSDEVIAMGADAFLAKTTPPKELIKALADLLGL